MPVEGVRMTGFVGELFQGSEGRGNVIAGPSGNVPAVHRAGGYDGALERWRILIFLY